MSTEDLTPTCGRIQNELPSLLYGELAGEARAAVELHLAGCAACREEQATLAETRKLLARWETPNLSEDPRGIAREIAARARAPRPRARLVHMGAALAGVAAALLFLLSLFGTQASFADGRFQISFALPGAAPVSAPSSEGNLEERVRSLVAQEVSSQAAHLHQDQEDLLQRCSLMSREEMQKELLRLSQAVDLARAQDQRAFDTRLANFGRKAALADQEQRQVITDLASLVVPVSNVNR